MVKWAGLKILWLSAFEGSNPSPRMQNIYNIQNLIIITMETITMPKIEFDNIISEIKLLKKSHIYKRLLEFEENIVKGKKHSRKELGF